MEDAKTRLQKKFDDYVEAARVINARSLALNSNPEPEDKTKAYALVYSKTILDLLQYSKVYQTWYSLARSRNLDWDTALLSQMEDANSETLTVLPIDIP